MTDNRKIKIKIIVGITVGILFIICMRTLGDYYREKVRIANEEALAERINEVYSTYEEGDYEKALSLAKELEEPYRSYYADYISITMELENWSGIAQELFDCIKRINDCCNKYDKLEFPDRLYSMELWNVYNSIEDVNEDVEYISEALIWYPEYYRISVNYYQGLFQAMKENVQVYKRETEDGGLIISVSEIYEHYMNTYDFYLATIAEMETLKDNYRMNERFTDFIDSEMEAMTTFYEEGYGYNALYKIYGDGLQEKNIEPDGYFYVSEDNAKKNYEIISNNYDIEFHNYQKNKVWDEIGDEVVLNLMGEIEHNPDASIVVIEMLYISTSFGIYGNVEVVDSLKVDVESIYESYFGEQE